MSWVTKVLAHFGITRRLTTDELKRTRPQHVRAITKADHVIADFRRHDGAIEIRMSKKPS